MASSSPRTLVLGTHNRKKAGELQQLLAPYGFQLHTLAEVPTAIEIAETGASFQENARLKAAQQAQHLGQWVLGEDSGLSVEALDGQPNIFSARFAGPEASDEQNNELLLARLQGVPPELRTAFYTCHMSLSDPTGKIWIDTEASCRGRILTERHGSGGFGYDPLFEIPEYHLTFGQLGPAVKQILSHRARACRAFVPQLLQLVQAGHWPQ